jgi:hypothetical protein
MKMLLGIFHQDHRTVEASPRISRHTIHGARYGEDEPANSCIDMADIY